MKRYYRPDQKYSWVFDGQEVVAMFAAVKLAEEFVARSNKEPRYTLRTMTLREAAGVHEKIKIGDKMRDAMSLGSRGGLIGGRVRANRLTPERRREIAVKAARTRWAKEANDPS